MVFWKELVTISQDAGRSFDVAVLLRSTQSDTLAGDIHR